MVSGETWAATAMSAIVVAPYPRCTNRSVAASITSWRVRSARARLPDASYLRLTFSFIGYIVTGMNTSSLTQNIATAGRTYYDGPELLDGLLASITAAGLDPAHLEIDDLAPLDEFHALGRPATLALARVAGVTADARVLDVGAGLGGPARFLASRYGAHVTALDATPRFCRVAAELTRRTGLTDRVEIVHGDALELGFDDGAFDL